MKFHNRSAAKFFSLLSILLIASWFVSIDTVNAADTVAAKRPNIMLIISDDQGWTDYGFMGHEHLETPALDKLAAQSITYTRGYTPVALCRPSLSTICTGLYPHQHKVTGNDPRIPGDGKANRQNPAHRKFAWTPVENFAKRDNMVRTLGELGYATMQTGKWWEGDPKKTAPFDVAMTRGDGPGARHGDDGLKIGRTGMKPIFDFIEASGEKPFFIWHAPFMPHTPHTPPKELLNKYLKVAPTQSIARYWAMCEWFDQTCGELIDYLDRTGRRENTVILYVCDNGWIQQPKSGGFAPRSKRTAYEGGVRTPIMVSWPGHLQPRMDKVNLASSIDLHPTVRSLVGLPVDPNLPGIDLTNNEAVEQRKSIYGESFEHDMYSLTDPAVNMDRRWIITENWKLLVPNKSRLPGAEIELYDLSADPTETKNLAEENPDRVAEMKAALDKWWDGKPVE